MKRWLAVLSVSTGWALCASPSPAMPVAYGFTAVASPSGEPVTASGTFSYDGDTHLATLDLRIAAPQSPYIFEVDLTRVATTRIDSNGQAVWFWGPTGVATIPGWPDVRNAFPIDYGDLQGVALYGANIFDGEQLRHGLTLADLYGPFHWYNAVWIDWDSVLDGYPGQPYSTGCDSGTPMDLCPPSTFPYHDYLTYQYDITEIHEVPVAEPVRAPLALLALVTLAVAGAPREGRRSAAR